ncbi:MAG: hypothetical protein SGI71_12485 [Verrucomicrobiota bacterium]|nr:hypothetical protein [Verrucomicrobiota bacterium]
MSRHIYKIVVHQSNDEISCESVGADSPDELHAHIISYSQVEKVSVFEVVGSGYTVFVGSFSPLDEYKFQAA